MAGPIMCDSEDGERAVIIVSSTDTGDTHTMCGRCLLLWAGALLQATSDQQPDQQPDVNGEAPEEVATAQRPPRPKRARQRRETVPPELAAEASPFPDATMDDE